MSNITIIVERALQQYPTLYKTRLDVLNAMFGGITSFNIDEDGEMYHLIFSQEPSDASAWLPEALEESCLSPISIMRENAECQFIVDNAKMIAADSTHDKLRTVNELDVPRDQYGTRFPYEKLSDDVKSALRELLHHYMSELGYTEHNDTDRSLSGTACSKSWNLDKRGIARAFESALDLMEAITGKTREQRDEESREYTKKLFAELDL